MESLNLDLEKSNNGKVVITLFKQPFLTIVTSKKKRNLLRIVVEILSNKTKS